MILPRDVLTKKNKFRDARIINEWLAGRTQESLAQELGTTRQLIYHIIRKNRPAIKLDSDFYKINRIHQMNYALANEQLPFANTKLDILKELRKEIDGEKGITIENKQMIQVFMPTQDDSAEPTNYLASSSRTTDTISEE